MFTFEPMYSIPEILALAMEGRIPARYQEMLWENDNGVRKPCTYLRLGDMIAQLALDSKQCPTKKFDSHRWSAIGYSTPGKIVLTSIYGIRRRWNRVELQRKKEESLDRANQLEKEARELRKKFT